MTYLVKLLVVALFGIVGSTNVKVVLRFKNDSDDYLSFHWVDPRSGGTSLIKGDVKPDQVFTLNSWLTHKFEVRQELDPETGLCGSETKDCDAIGTFQVTDFPEQSFIIKEGATVVPVSAPKEKVDKNELLERIDLEKVVDPKEVIKACEERSIQRLNRLENDDEKDHDVESIMEDIQNELHECMTVGIAPSLKAMNDKVEFERSLRLEASGIAENFTCVNTDLESSPDVKTEDWLSEKDGVTRTVHKKLDRIASRIHVVDDFASPEECAAMEEEANKDLHIASTADGKGGTRISAARKAMQAGIRPKFTHDGEPLEGNLISVLSARVYEYTNYVLGLNLTHHGQEPLMSIQYKGRGRHDIEPDRYTPHCDGRCNGEKLQFGGRMATMVIYCTLPTQGGFTNFQNANVHVRPNAGAAVFFSYIDPATNITDNGLTQHSGCPVYEGEKKIITQWVRYGVSKETPHSAFNTLGMLRSETEE